MPSLSGETRLHVIVGDPVGQTKSPAGLTAEFAAREVDAVCVPVHVTAEDFDAFMAAAKRIRNLDGIVVTIPHKFAAMRHCDEVSERAGVLGSVNVLYRIEGGRWRGDMTDGVAMAAALQKAGCRLAARRALLIGAGGAGSAVALALLEAGAAVLAIAEVDAARRDSLIRRLAARYSGRVAPGTADPAGFDLVVNATPIGMAPDDPLPVDAERLEPGTFVADLITRPAVTPLVEAARRRGSPIVTGADMFAVQAGTMADILLSPTLKSRSGSLTSRRDELWAKAEKELTDIVDSVSAEIDTKNTAIVMSFVENREYGVALEWLHSLLTKRSIRVPDHTKEKIERLARSMGISLGQ
jgi:shikimate dehydrogenase